MTAPRMKHLAAFCTLGVYVSLRSVPDLVSRQPRKAPKVKVPHESLEMNRVQNHWGQSRPGGNKQSQRPCFLLPSLFGATLPAFLFLILSPYWLTGAYS